MVAVTGGYVALAMWLGLGGARRLDAWLGWQDARVSASGMIAILSAIASGMIAFTGLGLSLAMVALQFGSAAYGPRLYAAFGGGRRLAHAVGIFTGTFVFALMAIREVDLRGSQAAPQAIPWVSLVWLLASVGVALLLLPRIVQMSIGRVLRELGEVGRDVVARVYRHRVGDEHSHARRRPARDDEPSLPLRRIVEHRGAPVHIIGFDIAKLVHEARRARGVIRIPHAIGDIVEPGQPLVLVHAWGRGRVSERRIRRAMWLDDTRATDNDPAYVLRLLVDTAIRALSPGINDPTTAADVLDRIHPLLSALGQARLDVGRISGPDGEVRVVFRTPGWDEIVDLALSEIAHYGRDSSQVRARLRALARDLAGPLGSARHAAIARVVGSP